MRRRRVWGMAAVAGLGLVSLTGCEYKGRFAANCYAVPFGATNPRGVITAVIDSPFRVAPGETFTVTVSSFGSQDGNVENPAQARAAVINISGPVTSPNMQANGDISIGSLDVPAVFPATIPVTVTGQPGQTITISAGSGAQIVGIPPFGYAIICQPDQPSKLVTIAIKAPGS